MSPGEFCVRGGLIDLYPTGSAVPYRIDLLGDEIETIRTFDVDTQRSIYPVLGGAHAAGARVPARRGRARAFPRAASASASRAIPSRSRIYKDVSNGIAPAGVEALPAALLRRAPRRSSTTCRRTRRCVMHGDVPEAAEAFWQRPQVALRPAARRPRPPAARAARALRAGGGPVRRAEGASPRLDVRRAARGAAAARRSRSTAARSSRCKLLKRFVEPFDGPHADRGRERGPARDALAVLRRARLPSGAGGRLDALPRVGPSGRDDLRPARRGLPAARREARHRHRGRALSRARCARRAAATRARAPAPRAWCATWPR